MTYIFKVFAERKTVLKGQNSSITDLTILGIVVPRQVTV